MVLRHDPTPSPDAHLSKRPPPDAPRVTPRKPARHPCGPQLGPCLFLLWRRLSRTREHRSMSLTKRRVEDLVPIHVLGHADMRQVGVLEGTEFWACLRVQRGGLDWIVVTAERLVRRQSKGSACFGSSEITQGSWAPCAGHIGLRPGTRRQHESCSGR